MAEFRRRKEKEIKRRRRNKRMTKIVLVIVVIWALIAVAAAAFHVTNGFGIFEGKKPSLSSAEETKDAIEQNEQQTLAEQNLKQTIESESKKEVAESEETSLEEKTEDATKASEAEKTVKKHEDPREDVWNHYTNMFIASKVNTYLNVRNQPTTDGTIIGKLTKYSGGELVEDMGNGWWHISSGGIDGYIWSENCVTGEEAKEVAREQAISSVYSFPTRYSQARTDWHRPSSSARSSSGMIPLPWCSATTSSSDTV